MEITVKLDRRKLPNASNSAARNIFQKISNETGATVVWEASSKTNSVRREPSIKISGSEESVKMAKEMLLEKMEVQSNRVVMKMEVTHLEHPFLIGKGGKLINIVRETTGCHIHFPDGNKLETKRGCPLEKINQVSIYGDPLNVESARVMIRALIPVQMYFEVPKNFLYENVIPSGALPSYDCPPPDSRFLAAYNGLFLYSAMGGNGKIIIIRCNQDQFSNLRKEITMIMELICCTNGANLPPVHLVTDIMQQHHDFVKGTNNSNIDGITKRTGARITFPDLNSPISERRSVTITGSLDSVNMAWQEIMNFLPVTVSFDVVETRETKGEYMDFLRDLGIFSYCKPNPKYNVKNVTLKGPEKFSKQMLQYRQHLFHLPSLCFKSETEDIKLSSNFLALFSEYFQPVAVNTIPPSVSSLTRKSLAIETFQQLSRALKGTAVQNALLSNSMSVVPFITSGAVTNKDMFTENGFFNTNEYHIQQNLHVLPQESNRTLSSTSGQIENEYEWRQDKNIDGLAEDYYRKKVMAARAMRRPIESMESAQVPSSMWAGYGFSQSMPAAVIKDSLHTANQYNNFHFNICSSNSSSEDSESWENVVFKDCLDGDIWSNKKETTFSHSNYFDFLRNMPMPFDHTTKDILPELLWQRGLHKYIDTFTKEEIDFQSFLLLTDNDLQMLGISQPSRVKLICLIRELQDATHYKPFDAAPGAERKLSFEKI
ncbi:protein bicaudal C homolog 1-B [Nephila pilipes]|uniref:Protein bicaudal C homolog 1-B n=1 Tax=Nephila pilipes TaxID=299642 RepID=A0A8X6J0W1_NEPPI|nr:protein bicaudal C homolog 1-B [Nephila pilipes]GFT10305.1 protein bicaudal C homolog 1-B [Nephila pilipes]